MDQYQRSFYEEEDQLNIQNKSKGIANSHKKNKNNHEDDKSSEE